MTTPNPTPLVLVVQHEDDCPPALVGRWLAEDGVELDVRRPYAGEPLPADLADHDGLLVLGGPMGAYDDAEHPWLGPTKGLLRAAVADDVPALGICLGHQLLAAALDAPVIVNPAGRQQELMRVGWTDDAHDDDLLGPIAQAGSPRCLQWNVDIVSALPDDAVLLARAATGEIQAARFAPRAWGIQGHPEVDSTVVGLWAASDSLGNTRAAALTEEVGAAADELEEAWRPLATSFARVLRAPVDTGA